MADLFSSKAAAKGLIIYFDEQKKIYSETFDLWCRKLDGLTVDDFKRGMEGLEAKAEESYRLGEEMWPPSYAEFRALAFPKTDRDAIAHKPFERAGLPEPKEYRTKRYEQGISECQKLLSMFDTPEKEAKPLSKADIDDLQRLEKIRNDIAN